MIRLALVPPKPKLLLSTAFTGRSLATWGTRSTPAQPSPGLSRFNVGGTIWSRMAWIQKNDSIAPAPPNTWPMADWVELIEKRTADHWVRQELVSTGKPRGWQ